MTTPTAREIANAAWRSIREENKGSFVGMLERRILAAERAAAERMRERCAQSVGRLLVRVGTFGIADEIRALPLEPHCYDADGQPCPGIQEDPPTELSDRARKSEKALNSYLVSLGYQPVNPEKLADLIDRETGLPELEVELAKRNIEKHKLLIECEKLESHVASEEFKFNVAIEHRDLLIAERDALAKRLESVIAAAEIVARDPYPGAVKFDDVSELKRLDDLCRLRGVLRLARGES